MALRAKDSVTARGASAALGFGWAEHNMCNCSRRWREEEGKACSYMCLEALKGDKKGFCTEMKHN